MTDRIIKILQSEKIDKYCIYEDVVRVQNFFW